MLTLTPSMNINIATWMESKVRVFINCSTFFFRAPRDYLYFAFPFLTGGHNWPSGLSHFQYLGDFARRFYIWSTSGEEDCKWYHLLLPKLSLLGPKFWWIRWHSLTWALNFFVRNSPLLKSLSSCISFQIQLRFPSFKDNHRNIMKVWIICILVRA